MSKSASLISEQQKRLRKPSTSPITTKNSQHPLLRLQQNAGNHATQQAAHTPAIQAKLSVNPPGDKYEQEADQVAANIIQQEHSSASDTANNLGVMRLEESEEEATQPKHSPDFIQRQIEEEKIPMAKHSPESIARQGIAEEEDLASMKPAPGAVFRQEETEEEERVGIRAKSTTGETPQVNENLESRIDAAHGGGNRLPDNVSSSLESHMGHDLSDVRVHTGTEAHSLSRSVQAEAFTTGNDIFFRSGRYNPGSENGRELLAHEVTHVVQQGAAPALRKEED